MSASGKEPRSHALTAAMLGGAVGAAAVATAAGVWGARAIARRNGSAQGCDGMNAVMKTAATACELSHGPAAEGPGSAVERQAGFADQRGASTKSTPTTA